MSGYTQSENLNRGSETMVDRYCNSLNILKEKVMVSWLVDCHVTILLFSTESIRTISFNHYAENGM